MDVYFIGQKNFYEPDENVQNSRDEMSQKLMKKAKISRFYITFRPFISNGRWKGIETYSMEMIFADNSFAFPST